jgi:hypothetical protein
VVPLIGVAIGSAAAPLVAALIGIETLTTPLCRLVAGHLPLLVDVQQQCQANLGVRQPLSMYWIQVPRLIQRVHEGAQPMVESLTPVSKSPVEMSLTPGPVKWAASSAFSSARNSSGTAIYILLSKTFFIVKGF